MTPLSKPVETVGAKIQEDLPTVVPGVFTGTEPHTEPGATPPVHTFSKVYTGEVEQPPHKSKEDLTQVCVPGLETALSIRAPTCDTIVGVVTEEVGIESYTSAPGKMAAKSEEKSSNKNSQLLLNKQQ